MLSSPDEKIFNIVKSPTSRGRKRRSPGSNPPRTVWNPESHWLVTVSWSLRAPEELPLWPTSTFRRTGGGRGLITALGSHPYLCDLNNPGTETEIGRVFTDSQGMVTPTPLTGCRLIKRSLAKRVTPLASFEVPPRPGRIGCHPRARNASMYVLLPHAFRQKR